MAVCDGKKRYLLLKICNYNLYKMKYILKTDTDISC